jgi:exopolyphosphatase/guanosine-5'-triphosphate,3'-diphosphate pyrophosphatase
MTERERDGESAVEFPLRVAAIDMGSNALRFVAAEFVSPSEFHVLESERVPVRLGHSAFLTHYLESDLIDQAVEALKDFRKRMDGLEVREHRAVATSAVRESRNGHELTARIWEEAQIHVEPIPGMEEGRLVWRAIGHRVALGGRGWILADLGGGSVEVSHAESDALVWTESLPLGTVRLLEELNCDPEAPAETLRQLLEGYASALSAPLRATPRVHAMIATGGNAEALADLAGAAVDPHGVRRLTREELRTMVERLASLTYRERIEKLNLREDRADVILPAAIVYERLAALAGTESIVVPGVGLKEGVLLDLVDDLVAHRTYEERQRREVEEGALEVGRRYRFDEAHSRQVTRLALRLFDELRELHGLGEEERRILLAAGLLHDIGQYVSYRQHHKHSRYLILHSQPRGLTPWETELVALVARYHRRARPKESHDGFGDLAASDRPRVEKLAALLRIADVFDRDHEQRVEDLEVEREEGRIILRLTGEGDPLPDKDAFRRKRKLFQRIFQTRVRVRGDRAP